MSKPTLVIPYDPHFLGAGLLAPLPTLRGLAATHALRGGELVDYVHYSLVMNAERKVATYTAVNIDGAASVRLSRSGEWKEDERIAGHQVLGDFYKNNPWDRGHLVRRLDPVWGSQTVARAANAATFYYSNSAPQHERFNQDEWVELEDWVLEHAIEDAYRACVYTGPVFRTADQVYRNVKIPAAFWKIIVARDVASAGTNLMAMAFLMKQDMMWDDADGANFNHLTTYQVPINTIERLTCLDFGAELRTADPLTWEVDRARRLGRSAPAGPRIVRSVEDLFVFGEGGANDPEGTRVRSVASSARSSCGCKPATFEPAEAHRTLARQVTQVMEGLQDQIARLQEQVVLLSENSEVIPEGDRAFRLATLKIVGGERVPEGGFRECVAIGGPGNWFCTGVLVGTNVVLTAAHCVGPEMTHIFIGRNVSHADFPVEGAEALVYRIRKVVRHEQYHPNAAPGLPHNDIAVLFLDRDVTQVAPVKLADVAEDPDSVQCVGFGTTNFAGTFGFGVKRQVSVPVVSFQRTGATAPDELRRDYDAEFEFVAGIKDKDTCRGDSGGPAYLIAQDNARTVLGLTSRSTGDAARVCGDLGVYVKAPSYRSWIEEKAAANNGHLSWEAAPLPVVDEHTPVDPAATFEPGCC